MQETSTTYSEILRRLEGVRQKENRIALLSGSMATLLASLISMLLAVVLEQVFSFGIVPRTILFAVVLLGILSSTGWFIVRPLLRAFGMLRTDDNAATASKVGSQFPHIRDRLLDALQMYESRDRLKEFYSVSLIDASFSDLFEDIKPLDFTKTVSNQSVRRFGKFVSYAFAVVLLTFVVSPSGFLGSMYRIVNFHTSFASTLPLEFIVEPGNIEAVRGQDVPITIRTHGKMIQTLTLMTRQQGQLQFDQIPLTPGNDGSFNTSISSIKLSTEYFASVEDEKSDKYAITVIDRLLVRSMRLRVSPPVYTRIPQKMLDENIGDVSAYPGTKIDVELLSSKDLRSASIMFSDSASLALQISGSKASGGFVIKDNRTYHVLLTDVAGLQNVAPIEYSIKVIPDDYPTVEILAPAKNVDLTEEMKLNLFIRLKDDFGFSRLRLAYRLSQSRYEKPAEEFSFDEIPLPMKNQSALDIPYQWDLSDLHLVPEDAVAYYVEVFDNDNVNGPKSGRSETFIVRLPSIEEVFTDVSQSHEQTMQSMQDVAKETQQLKKDIEELQRETKKNREKMDWQQQKKAEEMAQRYESMKKKLEETSQKMDEMMKQMDENKLLSDKTMDKYLELQKLMEELKSPELQEALKKLQQSMKQLSPEQMRQAMEQLKFSEEQFRQSLERTIELLKRIHIEQKIDELIKRTEELMRQQESVKNQASKNPSDQQKRDGLAKQQQDLQKQMSDLEKETTDLKEKMEEFAKEMPIEEMTKAEQELMKQELQKKMNQAAKQMQSGQMQSAQQCQQQSMEGLSEFEQQMKQVQKSLQDKQMKQIVNQMRKQLENLLELSKRQESLKDETQKLEPNSQRFREHAQGQNDIMNDLGNVASAMTDIAKKSFAISPEMGREIGNAMRQMNEAMQNMEGRNPGSASQKESEAMGSLNRAAMQMQNALSGMMGGQKGMGMAGLMGQLGQMAGMQGGINSGTQGAMGTGQGQGLTPEQAAEYGRLAGQQGALQKSLEQLSQEAKNAGEFSKLLGDLDKIAKDMSEVQTDLVQGNVNPETIRKQERILSRLLDSQRSMRERDFEKRRKAETGKDIQRLSPANIDLTTQEGKNKLRQELLKVLEGKYSKDYEDLIRKYFEQIEKEQVNQ